MIPDGIVLLNSPVKFMTLLSLVQMEGNSFL